MDLVTFLRERLDELELGGPGHCAGCTSGPEFAGTMYACDCDSVRAYMLADVAAKRRVVDDIVGQIKGMEERIDEEWAAGDPVCYDTSDGLLRLLAAPFAQHPDFDPAWAVEA